MNLIQSRQAFTANQTIDDVLVNNLLASNFMTAMKVDYAMTQDAVPGLVMTMKVGTAIVSENFIPSAQNRIPLFPDDFLGSFGVVPGNRIILSGRETSGVAKTLSYAIRLTPLR